MFRIKNNKYGDSAKFGKPTHNHNPYKISTSVQNMLQIKAMIYGTTYLNLITSNKNIDWNRIRCFERLCQIPACSPMNQIERHG
jgi:hypothetical protein